MKGGKILLRTQFNQSEIIDTFEKNKYEKNICNQWWFKRTWIRNC